MQVKGPGAPRGRLEAIDTRAACSPAERCCPGGERRAGCGSLPRSRPCPPLVGPPARYAGAAELRSLYSGVRLQAARDRGDDGLSELLSEQTLILVVPAPFRHVGPSCEAEGGGGCLRPEVT